jgi:UDP:flavonoid glycosyltransferase YjiC (YdhE family)
VQTLLAGFPLFDELKPVERQAELDAFLSAGSPTLVFSESTLSSNSGENPFTAALQVCDRLKMRAILLTTNPGSVPANLPATIGYFGYVPLSRFLSRCAAFIHHGGLGSLSQGLAAGVPQLTIPRFMDQPDNSRRLERLGVSKNVSPKRLSVDELTFQLRLLLHSQVVQQRCAHYRQRLAASPAFLTACEAVEQIARLKRIA